ncbi:DNA glycosylase [Artemisia annua]|uniref:DNA glycosylase n=1 Tax=Artemisia annua TaxID=35608 RepID=A0A2U1P9V8_ARTAN|nr:DNA glycosylase [Artemisia annua]
MRKTCPSDPMHFPSSTPELPEDRLFSASQNGSLLLLEKKLRAIVGNADALLKMGWPKFAYRWSV